MVLKDWLIRGIRRSLHSVEEREVIKDKIDKGYNSLLHLGIRNRALVVGNYTFRKDIGVLYCSDTKPIYLVKEVDSKHCPFVFTS